MRFKKIYQKLEDMTHKMPSNKQLIDIKKIVKFIYEQMKSSDRVFAIIDGKFC